MLNLTSTKSYCSLLSIQFLPKDKEIINWTDHLKTLAIFRPSYRNWLPPPAFHSAPL